MHPSHLVSLSFSRALGFALVLLSSFPFLLELEHTPPSNSPRTPQRPYNISSTIGLVLCSVSGIGAPILSLDVVYLFLTSAAKVQFSLVLCLCGQNPKPDPWSGSGDLAEPRTGPQFGVHNGPVPVQGGCEPRTGREVGIFGPVLVQEVLNPEPDVKSGFLLM